MLGVVDMTMKETNIALLSMIPEEKQEEIHKYLILNYCANSPYIPLTEKDILAQLEQSRLEYMNGEDEDFDVALDDIREKYGL